MKILVVDDEKLLVKGLKFNLENEGYEVQVAYDGAAAVELVHRENFDLVLLDWKMPGMDGVEVARQIRLRFSCETTVIILTAYNWDEIMLEAGGHARKCRLAGVFRL